MGPVVGNSRHCIEVAGLVNGIACTEVETAQAYLARQRYRRRTKKEVESHVLAPVKRECDGRLGKGSFSTRPLTGIAGWGKDCCQQVDE